MKIDWHVSWKRVGLALLIVFGSLYAVGTVMRELTPWYMARSISRDDPDVKLAPVPLPDQSVAPLTGARFEADGFSNQFPWSEAPLSRDEKILEAVAFPSRGVSMTLFGPSQVADATVIPQKRESVTKMLGEET